MIPINRPSVPKWFLVVGCLLVGLILVGLLPRLLRASPGPGAVVAATPSPSSPPASAPTATPAAAATTAATPSSTATPSPTLVPVPVHVLRSYPIDGDSDILPDVPLRIVFDQAMDPDAAALGIAITPELGFRAEWPAPDTLALRTAPRQPGTEYRLTLERARGATGGALEQPLTLTFSQGGRGAPIPILMYHHVDDLEPGAPAGVKEWTVSPAAFVAQLDLLARLGANVVRLTAAVDYLSLGEPLPARPTVITFDDGDICTVTSAIPELQARGLPATFFVPPQYAESGNPDFMTWDHLKALVAAGFDLGGHSYQHAYVQRLTAAEAAHQIGDEKAKLEQVAGARVECFAYPFGIYTDTTVEQLKSYGYRAALTIEQHVYHEPSGIFELGRIRAMYGESPDTLQSRLPWTE